MNFAGRLEKPIRVAVLGTGGREHALAAKLKLSPWCREVIVLPGNAGMSRAGLRTESADLKDHVALVHRLEALAVEFVVVGPDDLLAEGVVDSLEKAGFVVFGPRRAAARLEWSKAYAKEKMREAEIPTAGYEVLDATSPPQGASELAGRLGGFPIVLKYDGLALGKGVRICADEHDARGFLKEVFEDHKFNRGDKSSKATVVAEQFLTGHEVSLFALTDGNTYCILEPACDHKRLLEGNGGPNTGGMGAYSPVPWLAHEDVERMGERIFRPLLERMRQEKSAFRGLLYAGLMVRGQEFWVLEFNARFGDPETQAILPRLESDLLPLLFGCATKTLAEQIELCPPRWSSKACVNVVLASRGYPEGPETGFAVSGLPAETEDLKVFFAGVREGTDGLVSSGGRVLSLSYRAETVELARTRVMEAAQAVEFEGKHYRRDIGSVRANY